MQAYRSSAPAFPSLLLSHVLPHVCACRLQPAQLPVQPPHALYPSFFFISLQTTARNQTAITVRITASNMILSTSSCELQISSDPRITLILRLIVSFCFLTVNCRFSLFFSSSFAVFLVFSVFNCYHIPVKYSIFCGRDTYEKTKKTLFFAGTRIYSEFLVSACICCV